jgi:very-short-patch-repair endonuclease
VSVNYFNNDSDDADSGNVGKRSYWKRVLSHYAECEAAILAVDSDRWGIDPYAWALDAQIVLSPIEAALWSDIRAEAAVFYPQYPVAGFFVDFGNPKARVAIECDGLPFHRDQSKDARRQSLIEAQGWTVYRINGSQCMKEDACDEDGAIDYSPGRKLIQTVSERHRVSMMRLPK